MLCKAEADILPDSQMIYAVNRKEKEAMFINNDPSDNKLNNAVRCMDFVSHPNLAINGGDEVQGFYSEMDDCVYVLKSHQNLVQLLLRTEKLRDA